MTKQKKVELFKDEIIEKLQQGMDSKLLGSNISRTFYTQTQIPGKYKLYVYKVLKYKIFQFNRKGSTLAHEEFSSSSKKSLEDTQPKHMVRTDAKEQKMDKFLSRNLCGKPQLLLHL